MAGRSFNEVDVDFAGIEEDLEGLPTPRITLGDVLDRLRPKMLEQRKRGVTVGQCREVLRKRGIEIGERSLGKFLETGRLPGRKAAAAADSEMQPVSPARSTANPRDDAVGVSDPR